MCLVIAVLSLASLGLPALASAAPTVSFTLRAVPIPGFPHTGNILGAGTDARLELRIAGSEYFDSPPPLIGARFYAPTGVVLHTAGFVTCPEEALTARGPEACPRASRAGPVGSLLGSVTFAGERIDESGELVSFFRPGGGFDYYAIGHTPVEVEALATGRLMRIAPSGGYGIEEEEFIPLIATVPEGPDASVRSISGTFGGALRTHGLTVYYLRLPKTCPAAGFPLKFEAIFAEAGDPSKPESVTAFDKAPCPPR
jgi:hypothetical protein